MMPGGWGFGGMGGGHHGYPPAMRRFEEQYHVYSVAFADKAHLEVRPPRDGQETACTHASCTVPLESIPNPSILIHLLVRVILFRSCTQKGDKILLPPSAFDTLARLQVDYPMLFRLTHPESGKETHCGVLEFTAEEGCVYIPFWMMQNLLIEEGSLLTVTNVSLPKATFVKLQPQSVDFLEISNPRAVLEHALRNFSCVTLGDVIQLPYNSKNYHFALKEVQPSPAACIIETDCNVDFDAPVGYVEPSRSQRSSACPSPATTQSAASLGSLMDTTTSSAGAGDDGQPQSSSSSGIRIVDGKIVRPDDQQQQQQSASHTALLADRTGGTGVQLNAATLPKAAPAVDYWAVAAGDGARLDGKAAPVLKDSAGQEVDVRRLRAEAAAKRAEALAAAAAQATPSLNSTTGKTLSGKPPAAGAEDGSQAPALASAAPVSKRKTLGGKYSRLKQSGVAFQGSANAFDATKK
jgi:ubiquitin fusion degradation protein 1